MSGFVHPLPGKWQIVKHPMWPGCPQPWQVVPPGGTYSWSIRAYTTGADAFAAFAGCSDVPSAQYLTWNNLEDHDYRGEFV